MGMMAIGMVITVVGLGDKGFYSLELQLMGPIIIVCGGVLACVRILLCVVPNCGCGGRWRGRWRGRDDVEKLLKKEKKFEDHGGKTDFKGRYETALVMFEQREFELKYENYDRTQVVSCEGSTQDLRCGDISINHVKLC